jgi:urea transport system substrate-binding protein
MIKLRSAILCVGVAVLAAGMAVTATATQAAGTIKVGILHSLSGTMAISETTLKDTMMMLIDEQKGRSSG